MRLSSVHATEFKSVKDSGTFNIGDVTCLVGRNESGKTAILQALYRLNPIVEAHGRFDVTGKPGQTEVTLMQAIWPPQGGISDACRPHCTVRAYREDG
jgi:ABC-type branched-subunit amino acid transport system ATPase component